MFIIRRDGRIAYRQVATSKDDRVTTPELVGELDRTLGTTGPQATRVTPLDRAQIRVEAGLAGDKNQHVHGDAALSLLVPVGDHLVVGPWLGVDTRADHVDVAGAAMLRAPILGDAAAVEVGGVIGWATGGDSVVIAARADLWFAISPSLAVDVGAQLEERTDVRDGSLTIGVSRLLGAGARRAKAHR